MEPLTKEQIKTLNRFSEFYLKGEKPASVQSGYVANGASLNVSRGLTGTSEEYALTIDLEIAELNAQGLLGQRLNVMVHGLYTYGYRGPISGLLAFLKPGDILIASLYRGNSSPFMDERGLVRDDLGFTVTRQTAKDQKRYFFPCSFTVTTPDWMRFVRTDAEMRTLTS